MPHTQVEALRALEYETRGFLLAHFSQEATFPGVHISQKFISLRRMLFSLIHNPQKKLKFLFQSLSTS